MPQSKEFASVAAGVTVANVLSGSPYERVGGLGATVRLYAIMTAGTAGELKATLLLGSDQVIENAGLGVNAAGPQVPQDQIAEGTALPGDQITVRIVNDGAGANIYGVLVDIQNA